MSLDQPSNFVKQQTITRDGFLGGRLILSQPAQGFRAGLDSVLLGAAVAPASRTILDLGTGVGAAALVALAHESFRSAVLVDTDPHVLALAHMNAADNGFGALVRTHLLDAATTEQLPTDHFTSVIANPPYFAAGRGTPASTRGQAARQMPGGTLDGWVKSAKAATAPGGEVIFIHATEALPELLYSFTTRLGAVTILPLAPRPGAPAIRVLVRGIKGSRAPLSLLATRSLHGPEGNDFAPDFEAVLRGAGRLVW
jgi:tRNA1(Val) A37 N6-methylase TrmN6